MELDHLKQGIAELVEKSNDEDLLDFIYKLLVSES